jgi:phage tail-like protein
MSEQSSAQDAGQIIVRLGGEIVQTVSLTSEVTTIGRTPQTTVSLSHPIVSRMHAELRVHPEGITLTDLDSSNGTWINGERLPPHQPRLLTSGQSFQVGPFLLTYQAPSPASQQPAGVTDEIGESESPPVIDEVELPEDVPEPEPVVVPLLDQPLFGHPPAPPRPTHLAPVPVGPRSAYLQDLPVIYHDADFLGRFLMIFESLWEPFEYRQDHIPYYFDPRTAPASFLPWLASWLDLSVNVRWPESRLRHLLAEAMDLFRWRGTNYGLSRLIEVCTAGPTTITEDPDTPYVIRIHVTLPVEGVSDALLIDLIQTHKPAHVAFVLEVERQ